MTTYTMDRLSTPTFTILAVSRATRTEDGAIFYTQNTFRFDIANLALPFLKDHSHVLHLIRRLSIRYPAAAHNDIAPQYIRTHNERYWEQTCQYLGTYASGLRHLNPSVIVMSGRRKRGSPPQDDVDHRLFFPQRRLQELASLDEKVEVTVSKTKWVDRINMSDDKRKQLTMLPIDGKLRKQIALCRMFVVRRYAFGSEGRRSALRVFWRRGGARKLPGVMPRIRIFIRYLH